MRRLLGAFALVVVAGAVADAQQQPDLACLLGGIGSDKAKATAALAACNLALAQRGMPKKRLALVHINRASVYRTLGEDQKALADYASAIKLDPTPHAYTSRAYAPQEARRGAQRHERRNPDQTGRAAAVRDAG